MNRKVLIAVIIFTFFVIVAGLVWRSQKVVQEKERMAQEAAQEAQKAAQEAQKSAEAKQQRLPKVFTAAVDTSKWKTYQNDLYGYSIKYPANWEVIYDDKKRGASFSPVGETYYLEESSIGIIRIGSDQDVKFDKSTYSDLQHVVVGGREAFENTSGAFGEVSVYFNIGDTSFNLTNDVSPAVLNSEYKDKAEEYNKIFETMVSTFKFTK